ncbi:hypothetical protein GOP47_0010448 [Adiantum capillus-veneris]|uniref:Uncharacterized protein n=1 Tax=Adiantum capillus-veneris TaxID=13818 RepID=A0A9D4UW05_ADICA|nr:hypothetical protein GOP47_0010448 [Adiantum capillus-veneris]
MGTCMSKDKKGATVAVHSTTLSSSACLSSSAQHKLPGQEGVRAASPAKLIQRRPTKLPSTIVRDSEEEPSRESFSTDKHVVEIRLPITSPNKFKESPTSATLAARAIAAIARPAEEDRCTEATSEDSLDGDEDDDGGNHPASNARNPSLPLFYSSYLSGASFSRDLAAFSRDIASLSCGSPLKRSPSVNGAHDIIAAAIKAAHMSPHYVGHDKPQYTGMTNDDYSNSTRSRSLPKRFYGKGCQNAHRAPPALLHKRSSSRDAVCVNSMALSPRIAVRREEASGELRVCARQAASRRSAAPSFSHHQQAAAAALPVSFRAKERSPLNRRSCSTGKIAAEAALHPTTSNALHFQENRSTSIQPGCAPDKRRGRQALKDRPTNCASWVDSNSHEVKSTLKDLKKACEEINVKIQDARDVDSGGISGNDVLVHNGSHKETANLDGFNSPLCCSGKPCLADNDNSDTFAMYPASMRRVESWIKALAEMNVETSLLSEVEDSGTEVESELDLIRFAFDARLSPRKELQAQQARNLLLKEAAMDAFGRPSFDSKSIHPVGLPDSKQPSPALAALMSMRLPNAETYTSKIHDVLKLLSAAESEMGSEQKTLFYNQLWRVLESVKSQVFPNEHVPQGGAQHANNVTAKSVTSRANSWPRVMKEPTHIVMSLESNSTEEGNRTVDHDSSMKLIRSLTSQEPVTDHEIEDPIRQEQCSAESCKRPNGAQALNSCKCEVMGDTLEGSKNDNGIIVSGLPSLEGWDGDSRPWSEVYDANEKNGHSGQQAEKNPIVDTRSEQELNKEVHWGVESTDDSRSENQNGNNTYLASDFHHKTAQPTKIIEVVACTSFDRTEAEDFKGHAAEGSSSELSELSLCSKAPSGKLRCTATSEGKEMLELLPQPRWEGGVVDFEENVHGDCQQSSLVPHGEAAGVCTGGPLLRNGGSGCFRSDDIGSDASFEFRVRSTASTPLSTPSTPMLSTASTPRHASHIDPPLTAQALVEIWEAFD